MYQRKDFTKRAINADGLALNFRYMNGFTIEDVLVNLSNAYAFRLITDIDKTPLVRRKEKDYLIKLYTLDS